MLRFSGLIEPAAGIGGGGSVDGEKNLETCHQLTNKQRPRQKEKTLPDAVGTDKAWVERHGRGMARHGLAGMG